MGLQRLISSNAIRIAPSDTILIPNPTCVISSGTNTSGGVSQLIDTGGLFITRGLEIGDIIYNVTNIIAPTVATVTGIVSETTVNISANNFSVGAQNYVIYNSPLNSGLATSPTLYVGGAGSIYAETEGGQLVVFSGVPVGFFNVFVRRVYATNTTATNIVALF